MKLKGSAARWVPGCPVCGLGGARVEGLLALDCTCASCGWHYTSELKRAVLAALGRR